MEEYHTCVKNNQVVFNNLLRSARSQIKYDFERVKARWSVLTETVDLKFEIVPAAICSYFV